LRTNSRLTPFAAVALKFAAGYVIVAAYLVQPREASPFFRSLKLRHLAMLLFLSPGFSVLGGSTLSGFLADLESASTCASAFSSPFPLAGSRLDRIWISPDCSGFVLLLSGGAFRRWLALLPSLARRTKSCLLSSPAKANVQQYCYIIQLSDSPLNSHCINNSYEPLLIINN